MKDFTEALILAVENRYFTHNEASAYIKRYIQVKHGVIFSDEEMQKIRAKSIVVYKKEYKKNPNYDKKIVDNKDSHEVGTEI